MEPLGKLRTLLIATGVIWLSAVLAWESNDIEIVHAAAAILALISTMTIWSMWAMNEYGISMDGTQHEKPKRDTASGENARLGLLLSLLTPGERDALRARLVEESDADGEVVSLADLLAEQEPNDMYAEHKP
jgi:hypothetical protein